MSLRLLLLSHGATAAMRRSLAPDGDGLEPGAAEAAASLAGRLGRFDAAWCAPGAASTQTAAALGLAARVEPALADLDLGRWAGQDLALVGQREPDAMRRFVRDPDAAPHGGETLSDLLQRTGTWLGSLPGRPARRHVAVAQGAVVRAAVAAALGAGPGLVRGIDVGPLCLVRLHGHGGRWTLRELTPPGGSP